MPSSSMKKRVCTSHQTRVDAEDIAELLIKSTIYGTTYMDRGITAIDRILLYV